MTACYSVVCPSVSVNKFHTFKWYDLDKNACLGFYVVSTVFNLSNGDSSQIHVSWTIFNQYLTSPLSWHWRASGSTIPIILSTNGESHSYQF